MALLKTKYISLPAVIVCALLLAGLFGSSECKAVDVIVNPGVQVRQISQGVARAIFGMRMTKWPDGTPIRVFVLSDTDPLHVAFCKEVLNVYPYQLRASWDRLVYSGIGQAPTELASQQEMLARVGSTPGAIGYLNGRLVNDHVRILPVR